MTEPVELSPGDAPLIAAFSRVALPYDLLTTTSVERAVFADTDPQVVLGVFDGGLEAVGAGVVRGRRGWVKLLAVHPRALGRGIGSELLARIEAFCRDHGAASIEVGNCAPHYVMPGVDIRGTEAVCFFEARGYRRNGDAVNLDVRLRDLPDPLLACHVATDSDLDAIRPWVEKDYPNWVAELEASVRYRTCVVHDALGFACVDVNREGWFGPIATVTGGRGRGVGTATLLAALHLQRSAGHERSEIAWATALPFYLKTVGARISRVFWFYSKQLN